MNRHTKWAEPLLVGFSTMLAIVASGCIFTSNPTGKDSPTEAEDTGRPDTAMDTTDVTQDTGPDPVPVDELSDAYADIFCDFLFRCCSQTERAPAVQGLEFDLTSRTACHRKYGGLIESSLVASLGTAISKGRVTYDARGMANCLNELKTASCEVFPTELNESTPCRDNIEPQVALGDECKQDFECKQGVCMDDDPNDDISTCQKLPANGEKCPNGECPDGMYCDSSPRICQSKKSRGSSCNWDGQCQSSLCGPQDTCLDKRDKGQQCQRSAHCKSGACKESNSSNQGICLSSPFCDDEH